MTGICEGRVVIVTGAGQGIGRAHALEFARQGGLVVVNDLGTDVHGQGGISSTADAVAGEIRALGGQAISNGDDVADWEGAGRLVRTAIDAFGDLHVLVNNAGILRDRMLVNMDIDEWDAVIRVHLRGTFAPMRHAIAHWREQSKAGIDVDARVINTSSASGLYGNPGQANYGAAKAGIAGLTVIASKELARYGVTVNAIAPAAFTRMTESIERYAPTDDGAFEQFAPENISPLVVWLGSPRSREVTGRVFDVEAGFIGVSEGWDRGPGINKEARWDPAELDDVVPGLIAASRPLPQVSMRGLRSDG